MTPRTHQTYGAPFEQTLPVENPKEEQSAALYNRNAEDLAQLTCVTAKAWVRFATTTAAAPQTITPTMGASQMGVGSLQLPTVAKTAVGTYSVTYPANWTDGLNVVENIAFQWSRGVVRSLTVAGHVQTIEAGPVITLVTFDLAGAIVDLANGTELFLRAG